MQPKTASGSCEYFIVMQAKAAGSSCTLHKVLLLLPSINDRNVLSELLRYVYFLC